MGSDGCSQTLPDGSACKRFDSMCASSDSLGTHSDEPHAPEAGKWFDYAVKQLAANAHMTPSPAPPSPPSPAPPAPPAPAGGQCCYGGSSCATATNCQGGWCGASKDQCTASCNGMWCSAENAFVFTVV